MMMRTPLTVLSVAVLYLGSPAVAAESAQVKALFDSVFADKVRAVEATRSRADDAQLAKEILEVARDTSGPPELLIFLYEKVYDYGSRDPRAFKWAIEGLGKLAQLQPDRTLELQEKMLVLFELVFRNSRGPSGVNEEQYIRTGRATVELMSEIADAKVLYGQTMEAVKMLNRAKIIARQVKSPMIKTIDRKLEDYNARRILERRVKQYRDRFAANPADKEAAQKMFELFLVQMDDPRQAAGWGALGGVDSADIKMAKRALKQLGAEDTKGTLELADWYRQQSNKAATRHKLKMLVRALMYYEHCYGDLKSGDVSHLKARLAIQSIHSELERLGLSSHEVRGAVREKRQIVGIYRPEPAVAQAPANQPGGKPTQPTRTGGTFVRKPLPNSPGQPNTTTSGGQTTTRPRATDVDPETGTLKGSKVKYMVPGEYWEGRKSIFDFGWD